MAKKYLELEHDNLEVFNKVIKGAALEGVNIKILANNSLKEIGKVVKANDLLKHMTEEDVVIIINEKIFDQLEEKEGDRQKTLVADELIAGIYMNPDTERVTINKPDMNIYSGIIRKYTFPVYERLHESIKSLFDVDKNKKEAGVEPEEEAF